MKKSISLILCLCILFSFTVPVHATATSWDTSDQANLLSIMRAVTSYGTSNLYYYVSQLNTNINTIKNDISTIKGYLFTNNHSIAYWVEAINTWMSPIYNAVLDISNNQDELEKLSQALTNSGYGVTGLINTEDAYKTAHYGVLGSTGNGQFSFYYAVPNLLDNISGGSDGTYWNRGTPIGNLAFIMISYIRSYVRSSIATLRYYDSTQTAVNWGSLQSSTFTPTSAIDGIYKWFSAIQAPVARLSYVLANQQEVDARDAAALDQQAVVDNFIDDTGNASASVSDYTAIAGLSSGLKSNVSTDASPSGIWDIFNSSHGTWFSQETKDQLDTTVQTRDIFETPYLDQQIQDIYNIIGGDDQR